VSYLIVVFSGSGEVLFPRLTQILCIIYTQFTKIWTAKNRPRKIPNAPYLHGLLRFSRAVEIPTLNFPNWKYELFGLFPDCSHYTDIWFGGYYGVSWMKRYG